MKTQHIQDRIARATARLAQLQARELLARQHREAREKQAERARTALQRTRFGQLVFDAGCEDLADGEIVAALLIYRDGHPDSEGRARARTRGEAHLAALAAGCVPRKH